MFISYVISSPALLPIRGQLCQDGLLLVSRVNDEETQTSSHLLHSALHGVVQLSAGTNTMFIM